MINENIKTMYMGYFDAFNAVKVKDPELQRKIDDWKSRMEAFAATISNIADFFPKYMESGLSEEHTLLVSQLYMQYSNTNNHATADTPASGSTPVISVREFLEQYRVPYNEICKAGYRKRTEKAYENIFAVADRTDNMLEAQIILDEERLLWKIVSEDYKEVYEPILEATDPLWNAVYKPSELFYETYRVCESEEEMHYHGQRLSRQFNIIKQRDVVPMQFALSIAHTTLKAVLYRNLFWQKYSNDEQVARANAAGALFCRDKCRNILKILKESFGLTFNDIIADKHVKLWLLPAISFLPLGRYKKALPPEQFDFLSEVINEQIIPDISDEEFLLHETRSTAYVLYKTPDYPEAESYDAKIRAIANEKTKHLTYFKYADELDKKNQTK